VNPLIWLALAAAAGAGAAALGWPAWQSVRERRTRDTNADRYLAWRGRAAPPSVLRVSGRLTPWEQRRALAAAFCIGLAVMGLVLYFVQA
jgi:hypothetical protein